MIECQHEKSREEEYEKTKCDLKGNEAAHQSAPRMRIFAAFERAGGLDGRCAQGGCQTEQQDDGSGQEQTKCQYSPVRGKQQSNGIASSTDHAHDKRCGPPR